MGSAVKFTKSYLQTLSTDNLFELADKYDLFLSADLARHLLIGELLELDDDRLNGEGTAETNADDVAQGDVPDSYNMTQIRAVLKDPLWFFVFWEFHHRLFTDLTAAKGFAFFLRIRQNRLIALMCRYRSAIVNDMCTSRLMNICTASI